MQERSYKGHYYYYNIIFLAEKNILHVCVPGDPDPGGHMSEMEEEQQGASPDHNDKAPNRSPSKVSSKRKS